MIVYTAEMSGGVNFEDFHYDNLAKHYVNLILLSRVMEEYSSETNLYPGSFVLNPDLMGMVQQSKLLE
jgi:hypothetical protein